MEAAAPTPSQRPQTVLSPAARPQVPPRSRPSQRGPPRGPMTEEVMRTVISRPAAEDEFSCGVFNPTPYTEPRAPLPPSPSPPSPRSPSPHSPSPRSPSPCPPPPKPRGNRPSGAEKIQMLVDKDKASSKKPKARRPKGSQPPAAPKAPRAPRLTKPLVQVTPDEQFPAPSNPHSVHPDYEQEGSEEKRYRLLWSVLRDMRMRDGTNALKVSRRDKKETRRKERLAEAREKHRGGTAPDESGSARKPIFLDDDDDDEDEEMVEVSASSAQSSSVQSAPPRTQTTGSRNILNGESLEPFVIPPRRAEQFLFEQPTIPRGSLDLRPSMDGPSALNAVRFRQSSSAGTGNGRSPPENRGPSRTDTARIRPNSSVGTGSGRSNPENRAPSRVETGRFRTNPSVGTGSGRLPPANRAPRRKDIDDDALPNSPVAPGPIPFNQRFGSGYRPLNDRPSPKPAAKEKKKKPKKAKAYNIFEDSEDPASTESEDAAADSDESVKPDYRGLFFR